MSLLRQQIKQQLAPTRVSIVEFSESDAYCNHPLYPHQRVLLKLIFLEEMEGWEEDILSDWIKGGPPFNEIEISPAIRERRDLCRTMGYPHFREVNLVMGRRSGKGYMTALATVKKIHEAQALGDPGRHYGVDPKKEIYFTSVAASLEQAKKFQFADISDTAASCIPLLEFIPNFNEHSFSIKTATDQLLINQLKSSGTKIAKNFAKLRCIPLAANAGTIRGSTSLVIIFDEMAHMMDTEGGASAANVYKAATPATRQFGKDAIIFCNSSPATKIGQFYINVTNAMKLDDDGLPTYPTTFAIRAPSWEMFKDYYKDPNRRFKKALIVSPDWDTKKMNADDMAEAYAMRLEERKDPEAFKVEYRANWAEVAQSYLDPDVVDEAFAPTYLGTPIMPTDGGVFGFEYKGHVDPASTTAGFGFAMAHVEELPWDLYPGQVAKHVVFDLVKRWNPEDFPGHTIDYSKIQDQILKYIQLYRPYEFTFDQFQSTGPIQYLTNQVTRRNIPTRIYETRATAQKNKDRWETLKTAMNLHLVHVPPDCVDLKTGFNFSLHAANELKFLEEKNGKVDHQTQGPVQTKDIADCIAECTYALIGGIIDNYDLKNLGESGPSFGAEGGYGMDSPQIGSDPQLDHYYRKDTGPVPVTRGVRVGRRRG